MGDHFERDGNIAEWQLPVRPVTFLTTTEEVASLDVAMNVLAALDGEERRRQKSLDFLPTNTD